MKNKPFVITTIWYNKLKSGARMPLIVPPTVAYAALRVRLAKESGLASMAGEGSHE